MIRIAPLIVAASLFGLAACSSSPEQRGFHVPQEGVGTLSPGTDGREEVLAALGTPTVVAPFDDKTWFYIGRSLKRRSFLTPELVSQHVIMVRFDEDDRLLSVEERDAAQSREVVLVDRETPTEGQTLTLFEQLFSNIGRFEAPIGN